MKKKINLISVLTMFILCLSVIQASAMSIDLIVSDSYIMPGKTFNIEVWANGVFDTFPGDEVLAFGFDLTNSNPSTINFNFATVGSLFNDDSSSFSNTDVAGSAFPGRSDTNILLATLNFTALQLGAATLGIASDITDLNEGLVYFNAGNIDITSSRNISIVPEPSTFLLLASSLAGLIFVNIRQSNREL